MIPLVLSLLGTMVSLTVVYEFLVPRTRGELRRNIKQDDIKISWIGVTIVALIFLFITGTLHLLEEPGRYRERKRARG